MVRLRDGVAEGQGLALETAPRMRRRHDLLAAVFDDARSVASPMATPGLRLKKMVTLVNWLRWLTACGPRVGFPGRHGRQRHEALAVVAADVEQLRGPRGACGAASVDFEDDLVLVLGLLDQVDVVLAVGVAQQRQDRASRRRRSVLAWSRRMLISRFGVLWNRSEMTVAKPGILRASPSACSADVVDLARVDAGDRVGVLALVLVRSAPVLISQHRDGLQEREHARGSSLSLPHQLAGDRLRSAARSSGRLEEGQQRSPGSRAGTGCCRVMVNVSHDVRVRRAATSSARSWMRCICSGEEPSWAINTPQMNELSPDGQERLGHDHEQPDRARPGRRPRSAARPSGAAGTTRATRRRRRAPAAPRRR